MSRKNVLIALAVLIVAAAVVGANFYFKKEKGLPVTTDVIKTRDLEAVVSASGKIQPKRLVKISAETPGRVVNLAVNEGDRVHVGQFLLQIDPKSLQRRVEGNSASLQAAEASIEQMRQSIETARAQLLQAQQNLARQQDLWKQQLTTREALEKAQNDVKVAESSVQEREKQIRPQESRINQERATLESARYDLSKVRMESPIEGIVTRRNVQEGETAVIGTMNNAGTVLLELADMGVIQAEVEVDETNLPHVQIGQLAKITIDAIPDKSFKGHVTEIGNSPIQAANQTPGTQATNFKVVVILDEPVLHLHRRHHDGDAEGRDIGSDSCRRGAGTHLRRERPGGQGAEDRQAPKDSGAGGCGGGAETRPDAQGNRGSVRSPRQQGGIHPDQDGHRGRQVFRGPGRPEKRRPSHHRTVQLCPRHDRRRSREGGQ
jgi:HlyD family secretion protein